MDAVVKQAKVVIACAGPYAQIGTPVVDACVRLGTHYVDITGMRWSVCPPNRNGTRVKGCCEDLSQTQDLAVCCCSKRPLTLGVPDHGADALQQ